MILGTISLLITGLVILLFVSAALAPLESLRWWAGWYEPDDEPGETVVPGSAESTLPAADLYVVYLSGIGAIAGDSVPQEEVPFIAGLREHLPGTEVVADVFPYAVANVGLNSQRAFSSLWRWVEARRFKNPMELSALIVNVRNAFQVAVSADQRYGPVFNLAVAREIRKKLKEHGYPTGSRRPIAIVGWSGGGQIAVGSASFLTSMLKAPIWVVSLGGMLSDDVGLKKVEHLWHLYGTKDVVSPVGKYAYAGRWKIFPKSGWNQAVTAGKITFVELGPFAHNGAGNYFDLEATLPDGQTYLNRSLSAVVQVLTEAGLVKPLATEGGAPAD